jgi:hypothetical protein
MIQVIKILKNWKMIAAGIGLAGVTAFVFHYKGIYESNLELQADLYDARSIIQQQERDYERLEESLVLYQDDLARQREHNNSLRTQLEDIGDTHVQECLDIRLPDDFINRLRQ